MQLSKKGYLVKIKACKIGYDESQIKSSLNTGMHQTNDLWQVLKIHAFLAVTETI